MFPETLKETKICPDGWGGKLGKGMRRNKRRLEFLRRCATPLPSCPSLRDTCQELQLVGRIAEELQYKLISKGKS